MSQAVNYKAELVGVFGNPISENPTIVMQEAAFNAAGLHWRYLNFEVHSEHLARRSHGYPKLNRFTASNVHRYAAILGFGM